MHSFQGRCRAWTFCGVGFTEVRSLGIYMIRPHVKMFWGEKSQVRALSQKICAQVEELDPVCMPNKLSSL